MESAARLLDEPEGERESVEGGGEGTDGSFVLGANEKEEDEAVVDGDPIEEKEDLMLDPVRGFGPRV